MRHRELTLAGLVAAGLGLGAGLVLEAPDPAPLRGRGRAAAHAPPAARATPPPLALSAVAMVVPTPPREPPGVSASAAARDRRAAAGAPEAPAPVRGPGLWRRAWAGRFELRVSEASRPEKALALVRWLNEAPGSPLFGRGDLEATAVRGRSVKILGFASQEPDLLTRVRATSDPTGVGTFHDAYFANVRP